MWVAFGMPVLVAFGIHFLVAFGTPIGGIVWVSVLVVVLSDVSAILCPSLSCCATNSPAARPSRWAAVRGLMSIRLTGVLKSRSGSSEPARRRVPQQQPSISC